MVNKTKILGLLGLARRAGKIVSGADAVKEAYMKKKLKLVILSEDASERTKSNFYNLIDRQFVNICEFSTMDELGHIIGKTPKAVIGIKDINFAKEIIKNINGGDVIG
ncbi:MAG: 50S ribosomal protein L7ae [Clostridiales bacterium]|nr:50S ribosomal protein L7ae [Clostridiales bacterium]